MAENTGESNGSIDQESQVPLERRPIFWFYGSASMAYGIKDNAFSYLLLIFANQVLGLPAYLAATALAIALVWDSISDLLLGHWSDKTSTRYGRRHPFMYASLLLLPPAFYSLFNPIIEITPDNGFYYVLITALIIRTGTTLFEVPSTALLPDLEKDYDRRNRWLALRHGFGWYGGNTIHTVNFFFWVGAYGVTVNTGYEIYGTVGACVIAGTIVLSTLGTQKVAAALPRPTETFRFREIVQEIGQIFQSVKNLNFAALFGYGLFRQPNRRHGRLRPYRPTGGLLDHTVIRQSPRQTRHSDRSVTVSHRLVSHSLRLTARWVLARLRHLVESWFLHRLYRCRGRRAYRGRRVDGFDDGRRSRGQRGKH